MGFIFSLLGLTNTKSKILVFSLVIALLGSVYFVYTQKVEVLKVREVALQIKNERDQATLDRDKAIDANKITNQTLDKVLQERKDAEEALKSLAARDRANKAKIDKLSELIAELSKEPESKVQLSTILKETVRNIQANRDMLQGTSK